MYRVNKPYYLDVTVGCKLDQWKTETFNIQIKVACVSSSDTTISDSTNPTAFSFTMVSGTDPYFDFTYFSSTEPGCIVTYSLTITDSKTAVSSTIIMTTPPRI